MRAQVKTWARLNLTIQAGLAPRDARAVQEHNIHSGYESSHNTNHDID
jgi:hypothetical protein